MRIDKTIWKWLTGMFLGNAGHLRPDGSDRLVSDEDYDFRFGTKAKLPEGLRELKISEFGHDVLLEHFDIDLTVEQTHFDRTPEAIASSSRCLRWAKTYHGLDEPPKPPIRLHRNNVMLFDSHFTDAFPPENNLSLWLGHIGWPLDRSVILHEASTKKPLEDGFFTCARVTVGDSPDDASLDWRPKEVSLTSVLDVLADFVRREMAQPWIDKNYPGQPCENYLCSCYADVPRERLTHPVFSLLDFPTFDMGLVTAMFAGSLWSENELRLWSRPTYFHK